jgi:lysophospholipase L1-like esterase
MRAWRLGVELPFFGALLVGCNGILGIDSDYHLVSNTGASAGQSGKPNGGGGNVSAAGGAPAAGGHGASGNGGTSGAPVAGSTNGGAGGVVPGEAGESGAATNGGAGEGGVIATGGTGAGPGGGGGATAAGGTGGGSSGGHGGVNSTGGTSGAANGGKSGASASGGSGGASVGGTSGGSGRGGAGGVSVGGTGGSGGTGGGSGTGGTGGGSSGGTGGIGGTGGSSGGTGGSSGGTGGSSGGTGGSSGGGGAGGAGSTHWVGTWTASPYYDSANQPPASLASSVLRQVVHVSLGGSRIRLLFSNLQGNGPVTLNAAHVALCTASPAVDSTIDITTDTALAFSGTASVTIATGAEVWSDPIDFTVPALGNVTVTAAFGSVPSQVVGHSGSRTTSYLQTGSSNVSAASMTSAQTFQHWYYISGIDVMADASAVGAVAIGDSLTDGRGSDDDHNNRWTDVLAARLQGNAPTAKVALMNQGIGATNLIGTTGTAAQARFARDVLGQSGVKYAIVFDGVNDIGGGATAASLEAAYADLITRAHAKNVLIYGATITPFGGNSYYTVAHEQVRQQVNTYIKGGAFDGYIDFDSVVTDNGSPPKLQAAYATWAQADGLHPGPAGYQAMGNSVDLTLFTK